MLKQVPQKVSQQLSLQKLQYKQELRLMLMLIKKREHIIKSQLILTIKHGNNISRTVNSFLIMLNIMPKSMSVKDNVLPTRKH